MIENPSSDVIPLLISNLQCTDIEIINDVDVVPIIGRYVRERKALGMVSLVPLRSARWRACSYSLSKLP